MSESLKSRVADNAQYGADASKKGSNAYYLPYCNAIGHAPSYAACLQRHSYRARGELDTALYSECNAMIGRKTCPVIQMRQEELVEGKAIYFIDREKLRAANAAQETERTAAKLATARSRPVPSKPVIEAEEVELVAEVKKSESLLSSIDASGYAEAITVAVKEEVKKSEVVESEKDARPVMQSGLSLIEMARMRASNQ